MQIIKIVVYPLYFSLNIMHLSVILEEFFEKVKFEKVSKRQQKYVNYPECKVLIEVLAEYFKSIHFNCQSPSLNRN